MYQSYIEVACMFEKAIQCNSKDEQEIKSRLDEFVRLLEVAHMKFLLFGSEEQINAINEIVSLAQLNKPCELKEKSSKFITSIRNNLRAEVGMNVLKGHTP